MVSSVRSEASLPRAATATRRRGIRRAPFFVPLKGVGWVGWGGVLGVFQVNQSGKYVFFQVLLLQPLSKSHALRAVPAVSAMPQMIRGNQRLRCKPGVPTWQILNKRPAMWVCTLPCGNGFTNLHQKETNQFAAPILPQAKCALQGRSFTWCRVGRLAWSQGPRADSFGPGIEVPRSDYVPQLEVSSVLLRAMMK